jgi:recombination protein RecT
VSTQALKNVATGQAAPQEARNPYEVLKRQLETSKAEFKPLLGTDTNVDRFIRVVLNAVLATPDLLEADRRSLIAACMKAAQDGLLPDGREAVLNIYNTKVKKGGQEQWVKMAQYLPMVGGLVKKLYESGEITYIDAAAVYENDKFVYRRGDDPKLEHEPSLGDDAGKIIAAYAVIKLKNGEVKREVMPRRDIEAVRGASKSAERGPWVTWYDQQAIKSVIKRIYKQLPRADALEKVVASDNEALGFVDMSPQSAVGNALRPAQAPQALENSPTESAHFDMSDTREAVPVHQEAGAQHQTTQATQDGPPPYDVLFNRIKAAKDADILDLVTDEIRYLGDDAQEKKLYELAKERRAGLEGA